MTPVEKEWFLSLPKDTKLDVLEDALKENKFGIFMAMTQVLLEAPLQQGGILTEEIESVRKKYF